MGLYTNYTEYEKVAEKDKYYFKPFPYVNYDISGTKEYQKIKNFFKRYDFRKLIKKYGGDIYIKWIVRDEDTPEIIAHKVYGSTHYYWIILMINTLLDPKFDWALTQNKLNAYIEKKYGVTGKYDIHHYESVETPQLGKLPAGIIVDSSYSPRVGVTNEAYELQKNEEKRKIMILKPEYLSLVLKELDTLEQSNFTKVR